MAAPKKFHQHFSIIMLLIALFLQTALSFRPVTSTTSHQNQPQHGDLLPSPTQQQQQQQQQQQDCVLDTDNDGPKSSTAVVATTSATRKQHSWSRIRQRWSRRLNTYEDDRWVHKLSCLSWLLSLGHITSVGALNGFAQIPDSLQPWFWLSSLSTMFLGTRLVAAVVLAFLPFHNVFGCGSLMAMKYRAEDPVLKNGFISTALGQSAAAIAVLYQGWMNHFLVGNGALVISFLPTMIMTLDDALNLKALLGKRDLRPNELSRMDFGEAGDAATAVLVVLIPLLMMLYAVPMLMNPAHDRAWFLSEMLSGSTKAQAANVYSFVFFNLSAGLGSAAVTLRDRKLISKWAEQVLVSVFMVPAFVLAVEAIFLLE